MRFRTILFIPLLLLSIFSPEAGSAEEIEWIAVGFRAGISATDGSEDFTQYEAFGTFRLPWSWRPAEGWFLSTKVDLSAGALRGGGDTGFIGSVGPGIALSMVDGLILLDGGISAALLSEHRFGRENFGGPIQFVSHVGLSLKIGDHLGVGYRFQHMSNASIYNRNPGLDLHVLQLSYFF